MSLINTAQAVYLGGTAVDAVYLGATKVWPPDTGPETAVSIAITISDASIPQIQTMQSYTDEEPAKYRIYASTDDGPWVYKFTGATTGPYHFAMTFNSKIQFKVEGQRSDDSIIDTGYSNIVNTGDPLPPPTEQRVWTGTASSCASYDGDLERRTDDNAAENAYYGYYDASHGSQRCHARWDIPDEIRNCVSVDKVELKWWNRLASTAQPDRVAFVAHRDENLGTYSNSLGAIFNSTGIQRREDTESGGWISGSEWMDFSYSYAARYGRNVDEEIRSYNMQGFGLIPFDTGNAGYGYASKEPQMRITYTVLT